MIVYSGSRLKATDIDGNTQSLSIVAAGEAKDQLKVADEETRDLLHNILKELRIMNIHLSIATDINIDKSVVDD